MGQPACIGINGKRDNITRDDLLEVTSQMNIKKADKIIQHIGGVVSQWEKYAKEVSVEKKLEKAIAKTLLIAG